MPNLNAEIVFEGNVSIPVTCKVDTLKDLVKFGAKIATAGRNAAKLIPALKSTAIKHFRVKVE